jgi:hypothetical protein
VRSSSKARNAHGGYASRQRWIYGSRCHEDQLTGRGIYESRSLEHGCGDMSLSIKILPPIDDEIRSII